MKVVFTAALLFAGAASLAHAETLEFNGSKFNYVRLGSVGKVLPAEVESRLSPLGNSGLSCEMIASLVQKKEYLFSDCLANPERSICQALTKSLRIIAEGRSDEETPVDASARTQWQMSAATFGEVNEAALKQAVAVELKVAEANIEVLKDGSSFQPKASALALHLGEGSLVAKVAPLAPFAINDLGHFENGALVTNNNLLRCDIAAGRAGFTAKRVAALESIERTPDDVIDGAWKVYSALAKAKINENDSPMVQAAVIGFEIAQVLPKKAGDEDSRLLAGNIFQRLFDLTGSPKLREFASKQSMQRASYPDQKFNAEVGQDWSLR